MNYIVTFKNRTIHPIKRETLRSDSFGINLGVRIVADNIDQVKDILNHRFGRRWEYVHDEKKFKLNSLTGPIFESLQHKKVKNGFRHV